MAATSPELSHLGPDKDDQKMGAPGTEGAVLGSSDLRNADGSSIVGSDILGLEDLDPSLNMKMHLVNDVSCLRSSAAQGPWVRLYPLRTQKRIPPSPFPPPPFRGLPCECCMCVRPHC
jgi:hypothetical protein